MKVVSFLIVVTCFRHIWRGMLGASDRYQSNPSLHTSGPVLKSAPHIQSRVSPLFPSCSICVSPPATFHSHPGGKKSIAHGRQNTRPLTESWISEFLTCQTVKLGVKRAKTLPAKDGPPLKDDFTNLWHPALQTKSSFFCTKSGKYYDKIDFIYIYI